VGERQPVARPDHLHRRHQVSLLPCALTERR
jgi:hypothetical protein